MKKTVLAILMTILVAPPALAALKPKDAAPVFSLRDSSGRRFFLADWVGEKHKPGSRGVVLSFFASWCVPCRQELPLFDAVSEELSGKGVKVVLVDVREDAESARGLMADLKIYKPVVLIDGEGEVSDKYQVRFLPVTFFIGVDGTIKDIIFGGIQDRSELLNKAAGLAE